DRRLVACFSGHGGQEPAAIDELRELLHERLPSYMVPAVFVPLPEMPLTPSGKVDRRSLAQRAWEIPAADGESRALLTPVEEIVARLWAEVLRLPSVGPDDNFFQLGGHSLSGAQVISRLRQAFQVDLPLRVLFAAPTVAGIAAEIERRRTDEGAAERPAIGAFRQHRGTPPPLSFAQERFWAGRQIEARTMPSTIPMLTQLEGELDVACLQRALQEIVDRHEVLRTSFAESPDGPVQVVHPEVQVRISIVDLARVAPGDRMAEIRHWSTLDGRTHFDYARAPLFRLTLFRGSVREHALLLTVHHSAFDGWSQDVLTTELIHLYTAFRAGHPSPLPPLAAQYQDFARWQRQTLAGEALAGQVAFWREHLRGARPVDLALGPRPAQPTFVAGFETFLVPQELERRLDRFAAEQYVTLFMTLLAAFEALLFHETGQDDIVVTCLFANRNQLETEKLIGNFYAGLPLRTRFAGSRTFRDLLERVREVTLAAHEHPDILYEPVMEGMSFLENGDRGGLSTFRLLFQLNKRLAPPEPARTPSSGPMSEPSTPDLAFRRLPFDSGKIRLDLSLFFTQTDRLSGRFKYNRDIFEPERVVRLRERFLQILAAAVADPNCPLTELLSRESELMESAR
ncbi:MAG TPA: condensation domain-containing protein, partial [Thermoanaerobaculia bacterium]|nr:condensation domain-containing protein [Thermoanaerobaculia bacterium]